MFDFSKYRKFLIVNSRCSDRKLTGMVMWGSWAVASWLKETILDSDVIYFDENNEDDFEEKFKKAVTDREVVGFSITSMQIKYTMPLVRYIRQNHPGIKIVLGGIHPALFPDQDYEGYFDEVIRQDLPKNHFSYDLLPKKVKEIYRQKRAQVVTGFNCSYKCAFCVNSVRLGKYESVPVERVTADIDYIVKEFNPPKIYFRDEDFFQDIKKARAIIDHILKKGYKFKWDSSSRVTHFIKGRIDDDLLSKIVQSGCQQLRFGVESGSQRVLNFLRKGQTLAQIKNAVKQCLKYNIQPVCSILIGIPTETDGEREETCQLIEELKNYSPLVKVLGPQIYRPYPGGLLFEESKQYGLKFPEKISGWETYYDKNPMGDVFDTQVYYPWMTKQENESLPFVWICAHYGLNYVKSGNWLKRIIGLWFLAHWKLRWFGGWDLKALLWMRRTFMKTARD